MEPLTVWEAGNVMCESLALIIGKSSCIWVDHIFGLGITNRFMKNLLRFLMLQQIRPGGWYGLRSIYSWHILYDVIITMRSGIVGCILL